METGENEDETIEEDSDPKSPEYNSDSDFQMKPSTLTSGTASVVKVALKNRGRDLRQIAEAKVWNSICDRATASIVNATLCTYNIPEIIDKSKVRRAVNVTFEEDDRVGEKHYTSRKTEEHVTIVSLPDGKFLGHVSPTDGKAITVSKSLIQFLQEENIIDQIEALACDGTNTNVGAEGGINHLIEVSIGRAVQ